MFLYFNRTENYSRTAQNLKSSRVRKKGSLENQQKKKNNKKVCR